MKPARAFLVRPARARALAASVASSAIAFAAAASCVPAGNSTPSDAGSSTKQQAAAAPTFKPSENVMRAPFFDNFDRAPAPAAPTTPSAAPSASAVAIAPSASGSASPRASASAHATASTSASSAASAPVASTVRPATAPSTAPLPGASDLGPDWSQAGTSAWHIENGKLCGQGARNHGVWLTRVLPVNARIEFEAVSDSKDGDLKAEVWGDGQSAATSLSYTNATSYLTIFGGWNNKIHALARINEHGGDRKEIKVDPTSDDPRQRPVVAGQIYRFKVERTDGKTVRWFVDDIEFLSFADAQPLAGAGHDHFGFNDWDAKVCFDNVRVTPLP